jgi:flagellar basal-body rod protein FlgG
MDRGLYIAASGMLAELQRQNQLANDLANTATPGYKADRTVNRDFGQVLLNNTRTGGPIGSLTSGVEVGQEVTDLRPQPLRDTGEPLDLAIAGDGFFAVQTPQGVRFTRGGSFTARADGTLVDQLGNPVLSPQRQPVRVGADGKVDPAGVGAFAVRTPRKAGDGMFTGTAAGTATAIVRTGALEGSGVDEARTTVQMLASMRAIEASQKAITTIDDTLKAAAGQIGSLPG